jgi:hypothetical protein
MAYISAREGEDADGARSKQQHERNVSILSPRSPRRAYCACRSDAERRMCGLMQLPPQTPGTRTWAIPQPSAATTTRYRGVGVADVDW